MGVAAPPFGRPPSLSIAPSSYEALGGAGILWRGIINNGYPSTVYPTANLSLMYPFTVSQPCTATKMWSLTGTTASGNVDLGIYDSTGTLLVSKGTTTQGTGGTVQILDITDLALSPGVQYYAAIALDNITGTFRAAASLTAVRYQMCGIVQVAANFPLATGVTFAIPANAYLPWFGVSRLATF